MIDKDLRRSGLREAQAGSQAGQQSVFLFHLIRQRMDLPSEYVQFLCYVLEMYFTHKDLLVEYFQNLQENLVHKNE